MVKMKRSTFRMNPRNTFTCDMGYLVPIFCKETLPGDTWEFNINDAIRMVPMLAPQYTDISVSVMAFKVATRTIWDNFEQFRTGGKNNDDTTEAPYMLFNANNTGFSSLADYLGVPVLQFYNIDPVTGQPTTAKNNVIKASALPFRAYNKIWNEWLRVEHIQDEIDFSTADGYDSITPVNLLKRRWNRDYFTQALPDMQLGPQAYLPVSLTAPVVTSSEERTTGMTEPMKFRRTNGVAYSGLIMVDTNRNVSGGYIANQGANNFDANKLYPSNLVAELEDSVSISWPQVRLTAKMQQVGERLMLGGARMPEFLMSFFGVKSSDARLDRSEYLGGFTSNVHISPIMQTSSTDAVSPQGNQAAVAYHVSGTRRFKTFCEEDGWIIVLMSIRPRTTYAQGLHKQLQRWTRYDYLNPMFSHLSLQPLKNSELYATGVENGSQSTDWDSDDLVDNQAFGFHPIYDELRSFPNEIHGDMLNTRQFWHMGRIFDSRPALNSDFVSCTPTKRPFTVNSNDGSKDNVCLCETMLNIKLKRVLPKVGTPRF